MHMASFASTCTVQTATLVYFLGGRRRWPAPVIARSGQLMALVPEPDTFSSTTAPTTISTINNAARIVSALLCAMFPMVVAQQPALW
jgi:hypothetical protein